jgi:Zn-dependent protease
MQSLGLAEPFSETMNLSGTPFNLQILALLDVLKITMFTGSLLAVLNLLPMPPLDGSHILASALKGRAKENFEKIRPYGFFIFIAIVWTPVFDYIMMVPSLFVWGFNAVLMAALGLQ